MNYNKNLKLIKLVKEVINEVGDLKNMPPYTYKINNETGIFYIDDDVEIKVQFQLLSLKDKYDFDISPVFDVFKNKLYNIVFYANEKSDQYMKSDLKTLIKILKTTLDIILEIIPSYPKNTIFLISGEHKKGRLELDKQKMDLYKSIIKYNLPQGFRIGETKHIPSDIEFIVIQK